MPDEKDKSLTPTMLKARNEILVQFGDHTFDQALDEVKTLLSNEKYSSTRLALFAARSWIIRNKIYAMMNEPFVYSLNELENTNIFSGTDEEDLSGGLDGLFDDDDDDDDDRIISDDQIEISIIKTTIHDGVKFAKDMVIKVSRIDAERLVSDKKAKYFD
ncbi:hypothetical protein N9777_07220 [Ascidiaceihabitans sp.]|nr:hypothetical protein [Ascidiaceihabitans sp.]